MESRKLISVHLSEAFKGQLYNSAALLIATVESETERRTL